MSRLHKVKTVKSRILIFLASTAIACVVQTEAQTNESKDLRIVGGHVYDVTTSKNWVSISIPAGSCLLNAAVIHFTGEVQPRRVNLAFPHSIMAAQWPTVMIQNFPYTPIYF